MRWVTSISLLALSYPLLVAAQGRYPCGGPGTCGNLQDPSGVTPEGEYDGTNGNRPAPVDSQCVTVAFGSYCGFTGAFCTTAANCDGGTCTNGVCAGGFGQNCGGDDQNCLGDTYCLTTNFDLTASNTCGGIGAFCQDPTAVSPSATAQQASVIFNKFCESEYCNSVTAACQARSQIGQDCSADPDFACDRGLVCNPNSFVCEAEPTTTTSASTATSAFTVSGAAQTTKVLSSPVFVTCQSSAVYAQCQAGAARAYSCCADTAENCMQARDINGQNCATVAAGPYACSSTATNDVEDCCVAVYTAFFGASGTGGDDGCPY